MRLSVGMLCSYRDTIQYTDNHMMIVDYGIYLEKLFILEEHLRRAFTSYIPQSGGDVQFLPLFRD